ncbi:hypothetical protein O6H91_16G082600 [Diphasiastrum complanatum]|uniref:Uncharacterized protein n=2 Tax=Diphasiastrum complanatum TaxID=34168 RepID=A0ACC2BE18_DIPCM|nr:hypothetical protein O6H91_18G006100 [Diphasiastrum complanatum]KAJ7528073.1 hypothetical protein O6H91_16G082600 [Diphasiastrum complanatum]
MVLQIDCNYPLKLDHTVTGNISSQIDSVSHVASTLVSPSTITLVSLKTDHREPKTADNDVADHSNNNYEQNLDTIRLYPEVAEELRDNVSSSSSVTTCLISAEVETHNYQCTTTLQGHPGRVFSLAVSENLLYCGADGGDIQVWGRNNLSRISDQFRSGEGAVKAVLVLGDKIITGHQDHKIRVWSVSSRSQYRVVHKLVATLPTISNILTSGLWRNNYVPVRRHKKCLWIQHTDTVSVLAKGPANLLYSGSWDKRFKVWRLWDFKCLESVTAHDDAINALVVSPVGHVYTASADTKIKVWERNAKNHSLIATLEGHSSAVNALAMGEGGGILYSGSNDRSIAVWERDESTAGHMNKICSLKGHRLAVLCLSVIGNIVCSGSADKTIRVWTRGTDNVYSCISQLEGHKGAVKAICLCEDEVNRTKVIYSGSLDHHVKVWMLGSSATHDAVRPSSTGALR